MKLPDTPTRASDLGQYEHIAVVSLLERISAQLAALPAAIAAALRPIDGKALGRCDRRALGALLPAVWESLGAINFVTRELMEHVSGDINTDAQLRLALETAVGLEGPGQSRRLGRLLARAEGVVIDGLVVQRLGQTREGTLWQLSSTKRQTSPRAD